MRTSADGSTSLEVIARRAHDSLVARKGRLPDATSGAGQTSKGEAMARPITGPVLLLCCLNQTPTAPAPSRSPTRNRAEATMDTSAVMSVLGHTLWGSPSPSL